MGRKNNIIILKEILFLTLLIFILIMCSIFPSSVKGDTWKSYFRFQITNSSGEELTNVPILTGINSQQLVDSKYINSSGTNTNLKEDVSSKPYMVSSNNILFIESRLLPYQTKVYDFYTDYSPLQTCFPIILGSGGYFTVADDSDLELSTDASVSVDGYFDTNTAGTIFSKPGAILGAIDSVAERVSTYIYNVFPVISATNYNDTASGTSHAVNLPADISVNDCLLIFCNFDNNTGSPTITWPSGWTSLFQKTYNDASSNYATLGAAYKIATGSEGASVTVTTSSASDGTHISWRLSSGTFSSPLFTQGTASSGTSANPNPPLCTSSYSSLANCLYISLEGQLSDGVLGSVSSYPTNYTVSQLHNTGTGAIAIAGRYLNSASSDDPAVFTLSNSDTWATQTICIYPGAVIAQATGIEAGEHTISTEINNSDPLNYETFEWGGDGAPLNLSEGAITWTVSVTGTSKAEIDTAQYYNGTRSARWYRDGTNNPIAYFSQSVLNSSQYISFYIRKQDTAYFQLAHGNGSYRAVVRITDGEIVCYSASAVSTGVSVAVDTWYKLTLSNFNWTSHTFDIYMNDSLIYANAVMDASASSSGQVVINNLAGESRVWLDDITVGTNPSVKLYIDDVLRHTNYLMNRVYGVPNNAQPFTFMSGVAYANEITITVSGVEQAHYYPDTMILGSTYSTGTVTVTNASTSVTGSSTVWTSAMTGSVFVSTDGVYYVVSSVEDNTHLTLSSVYGGSTLSGQSYTMNAKLQDLLSTGGYNNGKIIFGSNSGSISITMLGETTFESTTSDYTSSSSTSSTVQGYTEPTYWFAPGVFEGVLTPELKESFSNAATEMGMPVRSLYLIIMIGIAVAIGFSVLIFTGSVMASLVSSGVLLAATSSTGILDFTLVFTALVLMLGIYYLTKQH